MLVIPYTNHGKSMTKKQGLTMKAGVRITMLRRVKNAMTHHGSTASTTLGHENKVKITIKV